ncbi:DUF4272 domain-containing protein [Undibacterium sp. CY18W]|uniref:DUF4272 domain-containing protein n=1 Tax=Undibacterium hunanense TaxID=2762292 RepID=A0ABR6ZMK4_9BURK|nr:DUF4272 domain-containing protein [Undibacterium hunanense]MBC3917034.1 DUF4272 domain-containing protein [Undibacterium hunanense]
MSPEQRKEASELELHKRGIRINVQLHVIESDEEVELRQPEELMQRMLALWAVTAVATGEDTARYRTYLETHGLMHCLSTQEQAFLLAGEPSAELRAQFVQRQEALYFLAWAAGLTDKLAVPTQAVNLKQVLKFFPHAMEAPERLQAALKPRRKGQVLDWSDLLYRLHWAVRHAHITGRDAPGNLNAYAVREWHQAANWLCQYEEEHDWDRVSTET